MAHPPAALLHSHHRRSILKGYLTPSPAVEIKMFTRTNAADSLAAASKTMIEGLLAYYGIDTPGAIPGIFNSIQNYYWWMAGAAWNVR